jgi:hypothetical protein
MTLTSSATSADLRPDRTSTHSGNPGKKHPAKNPSQMHSGRSSRKAPAYGQANRTAIFHFHVGVSDPADLSDTSICDFSVVAKDPIRVPLSTLPCMGLVHEGFTMEGDAPGTGPGHPPYILHESSPPKFHAGSA